MSYYALKFAYDGRHFSGFQRQPGKRTVEGDIRHALFRLKESFDKKCNNEDTPASSPPHPAYSSVPSHYLNKSCPDNSSPHFPPANSYDSPFPPDTPDSSYPSSPGNPSSHSNPFDYSYASRTDSGVSALGNVLFLSSPLQPNDLIHYLNTSLKNMVFHSYADVPGSFNPRYASERWYRYLFPTVGESGEGIEIMLKGQSRRIDLQLAIESAKIFEGTHDFTNFSKKEEKKNPVRTIHSINVDLKHRMVGIPPFLVIDVKGESFLRMMVRYLVGAIIDVASGKIEIEGLETLLNSGHTSSRPVPVAAGPLILMDVEYPGINFKKGNIGQRRWIPFFNGYIPIIEIVREALEFQ